MKTSKNNTVLSSTSFNDVFKNLRIEAGSLNATLRNLAQRATTDKDVRVIADWLGVKSSNVSGKSLTELRNSILEQLVFFTKEDNTLQPARLIKIATIDNVNYYRVGSQNWIEALKMICNRKNKGLDVKHIELQLNATYNANAVVITDTDILDRIDVEVAKKQAEKAEIQQVKATAVAEYLTKKATEA